MSQIGFVSTTKKFPWGGSEELWSRAALRLAKMGVTVSVNVQGHLEIPQGIKKLQGAGCPITFRPNHLSLPQRMFRSLWGDRTYSWLNRLRPDLVVISQGNNMDGLLWMQECAKRGIRFATVAQAASPSLWPNDHVSSRCAEAYRQARASFFVSKENLELTQKQLATPLAHAKVVRNPFTVNYDAAPLWPSTNSTFKLACVARLCPEAKGQDILLEVMSEEKWRNRPIEVTLFGNGCNPKNLTALKQMFRLEKVKLGGFASEVESIWASHHALVLPSRFEGLPLAIVEAMLCARPCIVTDVGGNAELLEDGVSGFIAKAPNKGFLDEALERAWQNRSLWQEMGQRAARRVRELVPRDPAQTFAKELLQLLP